MTTAAEWDAEVERIEGLAASRTMTEAEWRLRDKAKAKALIARRAEAGIPARSCGVTGAEADIEANYPGGLAAFRRGEPIDRTPYHKGDTHAD